MSAAEEVAVATTPERQQAAERELDDTIRRLAVDLDIVDDGEVITSWLLVGHAVGAVEDGHSRYFHAFSGGTMPAHVALGLLEVERRQVVEDDEG